MASLMLLLLMSCHYYQLFLAWTTEGSKSHRKEFREMAAANTVRLRSLPEAAERLGLSVKCLRGWVWQRKIEFGKVGRAVRISDRTIEEVINRGTVPVRDER